MRKCRIKEIIIKAKIFLCHTLFKIHNNGTNVVSVALLPTLNNAWLCHMFKIQKYLIYTKLQNRMKNWANKSQKH